MGKALRCAYCGCSVGTLDEVEYSIHRDGFGEGPEVPLCAEHGSAELPTCEQIWDRIAAQKEVSRG